MNIPRGYDNVQVFSDDGQPIDDDDDDDLDDIDD